MVASAPMPARPAPPIASLSLPALSLLALSVLVLGAIAPAAADTVHLRNGRAYEGVIAERTVEGVRIQLAFGHLVLPADQVVAVEKSDSPLAAYLSRKADLAARPGTSPAQWLALARWAKANDLAQGVREAATLAAELDPRLPGLDPLLRPFGLVFDEAAGRWLPFEEAMARRGLVRFEGEWITVAEQRLRLAERQRERALAAEEATSRRLAAVAAAMLAREEREARREAEAGTVALPWNYAPVTLGWAVPGVVVVTHGGFLHPHHPRPPHHPGVPMPPPGPPRPPDAPGRGYGSVFDRVPGSLLPVSPSQPRSPASSSSTRPAASGR